MRVLVWAQRREKTDEIEIEIERKDSVSKVGIYRIVF